MKKRILITGLCLQGNKGGPAIALSLMAQIEKYYPVNFILSVPGDENFENEKKWAKIYGVDVIIDAPLRPIRSRLFYRIKTWRDMSIWIKALKSTDLIVDMTAISYVGPPIGRFRDVVRNRFRYFLTSKLVKRPFIAWTQSYGPLSTASVRLLAKFDLNFQPIIFCRGENCRVLVKKLLPKKDVRSFPDVACVLSYDLIWGKKYLQEMLNWTTQRIVTISPSAVIYNKTSGVDSMNFHVQQIVQLCKFLNDQNYTVVLVPHTLRINYPTPKSCDHAVCCLVKENCNDDHVYIVNQDLTPIQLKSIIANAHIHVGARYHSLVASLSAGVPSISLSWHPKYKDLMNEYQQNHYVFDAIANSNDLSSLFSMFNEIISNYDSTRSQIQECHSVVKDKIEENTRLFIEIMETI